LLGFDSTFGRRDVEQGGAQTRVLSSGATQRLLGAEGLGVRHRRRCQDQR
jgi:hypothetical protein